MQEYIKNNHGGNCDVVTIEGGKFVGDSDVGEFWSLFGGYAPITREPPRMTQEKPKTSCVRLFWTYKDQMNCMGNPSLNKEMLSANKCSHFCLDGKKYYYIRTKGCYGFVTSEASHITFLTDGSETPIFRSYFSGWSGNSESTLFEEGREKVAALFKQKGFDVKELPDEDFQPFIDCSGVLKVWRVDCHDVTLIPTTEHDKLFSGDCYIMQYVYHGYENDENIFYAWLGEHSIMDRADVIDLMCSMADSLKGHPLMAQVFEGKETLELLSIFERLIIFKSLTSLNSSYCYILQVGGSVFTWTGNLCSPRDHDLLDRMLDLLFSMQQTISVREGSEAESFWDTLGGKDEYPKDKEIKQWEEEPHLFACTLSEGDLKVKEIFDFAQDDLTTEEVLVLDCYREIYVWNGLHAGDISKQEALALCQKFLKVDILQENLSPRTPKYIVTEGHELPFFTRFFDWDSSKAHMHGNSFERKLAILKAQGGKLEI
ncbi:hypothetical protein H6P81_006877 [Aristolochia fimbriata]|uniref:Gelsolin-like domain-containing protein n=1 Tax=Aristolochia fimbriata TaxID=158543 RepID=A0AAV7EYW9_ARIFI|nr:hypothetical protein H6P81_006877 [Aristolochia fimbriata]